MTPKEIAEAKSTLSPPENCSENLDRAWFSPVIMSAIIYRADKSIGDAPAPEYNEPDADAISKGIWVHLTDRVFRKKISAHLDIYGNAVVHIARDLDGVPSKLTTVSLERVSMFLDPKTTAIASYVYRPPRIGAVSAATEPEPIILDPNDVLHFRSELGKEYAYGLSKFSGVTPLADETDILAAFGLRHERVEGDFSPIDKLKFNEEMRERREHITKIINDRIIRPTVELSE